MLHFIRFSMIIKTKQKIVSFDFRLKLGTYFGKKTGIWVFWFNVFGYLGIFLVKRCIWVFGYFGSMYLGI